MLKLLQEHPHIKGGEPDLDDVANNGSRVTGEQLLEISPKGIILNSHSDPIKFSSLQVVALKKVLESL